MSEHTQRRFLNDDQVHHLNEIHGWFQFGDAQSDVSRAFAQDAIAMHERIRAVAPDLLTALERLSAQCDRLRLPGQALTDAEKNAREVIAKAAGHAKD